MRTISFALMLLLLLHKLTFGQFQYTAPKPESRFHDPRRTIIIREGSFLNPASLLKKNLFTVFGSLSGEHKVEVILSDDGKTIILKPLLPFRDGEKVSVIIHKGLEKKNREVIDEYSFSFYIRPFRTLANEQHLLKVKQRLWEQEIGKHEGNLVINRNDPGFPHFTIDVNTNPAPGELFFYNFNTLWVNPMFNCIMTSDGDSVYAYPSAIKGINFDLNRNGYLTTYNIDSSYYEMWDSSYNLVGTYEAGNGYIADSHEFQIYRDGHSFLICQDPQIIDMTVYDSSYEAAATVIGAVLQELDSAKNVVFEWRSWDYVEITEAVHISFATAIIDYVHANAIELDHDGNLLFSCRMLDQVLKISRSTGEIMWRLGGQKNEFTFINDSLGFNRQHDIRRLPNGNVTLFDNGNWHPIPRSYAKEYVLDEVNKTATLVWSYTLPLINGGIVVSWAMGNVQRLPNGNTLINWATFYEGPDVTEVDSNGNIVWSFTLTNNDSTSYAIYRAHRYEWKPCARPTAGLMSTSNISVSSAQLNWTNATNASYYKVEYRTSNANSWIEAYVPSYATFYSITNLKPLTTYDWRIQSVCDSLHNTSNYSAVQSFTTLSDTLDPIDPTIEPQPIFVYPNPVRDQLNISIALDEPGNVKLRLINLPGQLVKQGEWFSAETETTFILPVDKIPAGMYLLELYYDEKKVVQKVVIE